MSLIPAFKIGVWNAWIFIVPYFFMNFGLTFLLKAFKNRKSTFWAFPQYNRLEKMYLLLFYVIQIGLSVYSIFLPLAVGTAWLYAGLFVYLLGIAFLSLTMRTFTTTPVDKPNTAGIYRITRHPWYIGLLGIYIGVGIASASWVYILANIIWIPIIRNLLMVVEERECCERFGDIYREYMNRTPRWIGIPGIETKQITGRKS
jgi:protein-S-isoprenylcysteine O-methyltransferase Ste14